MPEFQPILPSDRELRGELLEFGVQLVNPWVIRLPKRNSKKEALRDLKMVFPKSDFAYITKIRKVIFQTRVGFFPSEARARDFIKERGKEAGGLWTQAKVIRIDFEESLPGQNIRFRQPQP